MTLPLFKNILDQPDALRAVLHLQSSEGSSALQRAASLLKQSSKVVLTGMGASFFACGPLRYYLARSGVAVSAVETAELLYFLDQTIDNQTTVVLVSRSGESVEVIKLLDLLAKRGCKTIGFANVPESTLLRRTDVQILLGSPADQLVAIQTYIATVAALLLLGAASTDNLQSALDQLASTADVLQAFLPNCLDASQHWHSFYSTFPLYILGRGPSLASVDEGVLLMHETAKFTGIGMSIAQFRHGPVEVVDANMRAVVIGTQSETSELDRKFAEDLLHMDADVRWIGPGGGSGGSMLPSLVPWPENVPELFRPIVEIVPLQLLAYRTAESRGVTPGDFRWAPAITSSESGFPYLRK